ncbi:MAG: HAD-IC family P-type ATPase, partial [Omnitrophica WOR_2 bacterium]
MAALIQGLSNQEVLERRARGLGNRVPLKTGRSYFQIVRENVFTFVNNVLIGLGIALVLLGRPSDAFVSVLVILANVLVSVYQEIRAKRVLDRIALLTRPRVTVMREGKEQTLDPDEVVVGDILLIEPGDQIVTDGQVVGDGRMEVDESLLTGESDLIPKRSGDTVFSGSFCVTGKALVEAQKVGAQSLANQMATEARAFRRILTPLQQQINLAVRVILFLAIFMEILLGLRTLLDRIPLVESVRMSVVIIGLVPNGLFLAISAAYAMGAVRMAGKGALVQQANAIESLSNVDVLCLDKTGTLTTNRIRFHSLQALDCSELELREVLGDYAASLTSGNRTSDAIAESMHGFKRSITGEIPFSSSRKYSALSFDEPERHGTFVLGAPEVLRDRIRGDGLEGQAELINEWSDRGLRVLLFAGSTEVAALTGENGKANLPAQLNPLGLICMSDELKPGAEETLQAFTQSGVRLKIISGDNPRTVA